MGRGGGERGRKWRQNEESKKEKNEMLCTRLTLRVTWDKEISQTRVMSKNGHSVKF